MVEKLSENAILKIDANFIVLKWLYDVFEIFHEPINDIQYGLNGPCQVSNLESFFWVKPARKISQRARELREELRRNNYKSYMARVRVLWNYPIDDNTHKVMGGFRRLDIDNKPEDYFLRLQTSLMIQVTAYLTDTYEIVEKICEENYCISYGSRIRESIGYPGLLHQVFHKPRWTDQYSQLREIYAKKRRHPYLSLNRF